VANSDKDNVQAGNVDFVSSTMDSLMATARAENAYGQPVEHEGRLIIPASEVLVAMGFGGGYGSGSEEAEVSQEGEAEPAGQAEGGGGGGGGRTLARPVAVIVVEQGQVRVEPVIDVTKLGVTLLTALGAMALASSKMMKKARS
jgi:uncharacterized spore protein YtfJ